MEAIRLFKLLNRDQRNTFVACFLGWALDALDFFLVTFVLVPIGHDFGQSIPKVAFAITLTLMMRPVGAFIFGWFGDKFGRRIPFMPALIFFRVGRLILRRRVAGIFSDLHSRACSGIAGLATRSRSAETATEDVDLRPPTWRLVHLRRASDDGVQLHVAWDAGFVRDVSGKTARFRGEREIDDRHRLRNRCDLRRDRRWISFAAMGPSPFNCSLGRIWDAPDSTLDFRSQYSASHHGRIFDSVHGARRMGSCARALERTFAAGIPRHLSRSRLSVGKLRCGLCRPATSVVGGTFPAGKRRTKLRADDGAGGSGRFSRSNFSRSDR